jgi:predicted lysophospholipase L1 biosynthesis ABC-type transport system permease subunit
MIVVVLALVVFGTFLLPLAQRTHDTTIWIITIGFYVLALLLLLADLFLFRWYARRQQRRQARH